MKHLRYSRTLVATLLFAPAPAWAYLGSFEPADGYNLGVYASPSPINWSDVSYYNAGNYGANAGGGSGPTVIAPDSGKWKVVSQVGGYFTSAATRSTWLAGSPPYPNSLPPSALPAYIVGEHSPGRTGYGSLAVRNDSPSGTGPLVYNYQLDSYDFGGISPASVTSGVVGTQFYFCPNPVDATKADKFRLSFRDSLGNIGMEWGYGRDNTVTWRTSPSSAWNYTSILANASNWDGVRVDIDLGADTFSFDYYDVSANLWSNVVPAGTALGTPLQDLTNLDWRLEDAVNSGVGGKNFFDDFSFQTAVPEAVPGAALPLLFAGAAFAARRRQS
jgi:hypothetical protein